jgi:hypothetical protein
MPTTDATPFEGWTILELMGHRRLGGYVREVTVAGAGFLRIDVYGHEGEAVATQLYPPSSVYCMTPTTEAMARAAGQASHVQPVSRWELPKPETARMAAEDDDTGLRGKFGDDDIDRDDDDRDDDDRDEDDIL